MIIQSKLMFMLSSAAALYIHTYLYVLTFPCKEAECKPSSECDWTWAELWPRSVCRSFTDCWFCSFLSFLFFFSFFPSVCCPLDVSCFPSVLCSFSVLSFSPSPLTFLLCPVLCLICMQPSSAAPGICQLSYDQVTAATALAFVSALLSVLLVLFSAWHPKAKSFLFLPLFLFTS